MRAFSFRPALGLRGREFKGVRGFAGKPFHPPLTDVTVGAYAIASFLDIASYAFRTVTGPLMRTRRLRSCWSSVQSVHWQRLRLVSPTG
jgi:uncharacterized membrane protein